MVHQYVSFGGAGKGDAELMAFFGSEAAIEWYGARYGWFLENGVLE
jgi:hypothetical protein